MKKKLLALAVLPASTMLSLFSSAQVAAQGSLPALEEVVVTAQRRAETIERTPVSMAILSGDEMRERAIVSEMDLQNMAGVTVKAAQNGNQLNYAIRGQTVDAFSSSRPSVLPYINEVQIGLASSSVFYDLDSIQILKGPQGTLFGRNSTGGAVLFTTAKPTDEFEGYGSIWGGNYGEVKAEGAVNIPLADDRAILRLSGFYQDSDGWQDNVFRNETLGGIERKSVRVSFTLNPTDNISNEFVATYYDADGNNISAVAINSFNPSNDSAFVPASILYSPLMDVAFGFEGAWDLFLDAHPGVNPEGLSAEVERMQRELDFYDASADAPSLHTAENLIISNLTTIQLTENLELRNIIGYNDMDQNNTGEFDGTHYPIDDLGSVGRRNELTQFSEELQLQGTTDSGLLTYVAGLYYSDEEDEQRSLSVLFDFLPIAPPVGQINSGVTSSETIAVYGQGTYDLSEVTGVEGLGFTLGARYSKEDIEFDRNDDDFFLTTGAPPGAVYVDPLDETFNQVSWTVGVQWQLSDATLLYAASRKSFRSGGFNFYAPPVIGSGNEADATFGEEEGTDVELGYKYLGAIGDMPTRVNLAFYRMIVEDLQRSNYVAVFGSLAGITVNVPEAEMKGMDLDLTLAPTDWLTVGGSLSLQDAEFTENVVSVLDNPDTAFGPYPDTPDWSGSIFADARFQVGNGLELTLYGEVYGQDETFFSSTHDTLNPGSQIDSYTVTNFRVAISDEEAGWTLAGHLRNAFEEEYYVGGIGFKSLFSTNIAIPAAPRTWMIEASYRF
jgi:iron complex outermembrane receptor protein